MLTATCDVCGQTAISSTQVDRYQFRIDLCQQHLKAWTERLLLILPKYRKYTGIDHKLARAFMDAIVDGGYSAPLPSDNGSPSPAPAIPANNMVLEGIKELHRVADHFIKISKPI